MLCTVQLFTTYTVIGTEAGGLQQFLGAITKVFMQEPTAEKNFNE